VYSGRMCSARSCTYLLQTLNIFVVKGPLGCSDVVFSIHQAVPSVLQGALRFRRLQHHLAGDQALLTLTFWSPTRDL